MSAGASADREVLRSRLRIDEYRRLLAAEHERLQGFQAAGRTERRIAGLLEPMHVWGWRLLPDRRWPGTRHANVDMVHVGPGGALMIDVKSWAEPRIEGGTLFRGDVDATDDIDKLLRVTDLAEQAVAGLGLVPLEVTPVIVLAGRRRLATRLGRVHVVGEPDLLSWVMRRGQRLTDEQVTLVAGTLATTFPAHEEPGPVVVGIARPEPVIPRVVPPPVESGTLFDPADLELAILEAALAEPIESWMTFLHPDQARLVKRSWNGPARVRGPAGTGKTVVGLHRAAYLAATRPGRILYTSYVRTLPKVLAQLFARLAPTSTHRVEFSGIHAWACALLRERRVPFTLDRARAASMFNRAWARQRRGSPLAALDVSVDYWRDEIDWVIKGRGLTDFDQYADLVRVGRRTPLQPEHRAAVWDLYTEYDGLMRAAGLHDFNDVLLMALAEVLREPPQPAYTAVVVDEVQDLTCVGVRLLHALVGDRPDGLLLIGDGQQAVYPGGFTLVEAGIAVTGRGTVLRTNYRNAAEILDAAAEVVADDAFDDLDGSPVDGHRDVEVARRGGQTIVVEAADVTSHDIALVTRLRQSVDELGVRYGDMAVLAPSNALATRYAVLLASYGIPAVTLDSYDGTTSTAVKVGTFQRAKGLEFAYVFLPQLRHARREQQAGESDSAYREGLELERRQLYVGMTRARDGLWLGYLTG